MRLQNIVKLLSVGAIALVMAGCGGGSGDGGSSTPGGGGTTPQESYSIRSSDSPIKVTIPYGENVIAGGVAIRTLVYDSEGNSIEPLISDNPNSFQLGTGNYTFIIEESTNRYSNSQGVLFYLSSNIYVGNLPLNTTVVFSERTSDVYKLVVDVESSYLLNNSRSTTLVYDSSLNRIGTTNNGDSDMLTNPLDLLPGTYYFVTAPSTFIKEGSFSVTSL